MERKEAESNQGVNTCVKSLLTQMMGELHTNKGSRCQGWKTMSIAIHAGAAETVVPHTFITKYTIMPTQKSESGARYASATGEPIPNLGEQRLPMATTEGSLRAMTFQAAPVAKPLGSVTRVCQAGHVVVFDSEGLHILNNVTG